MKKRVLAGVCALALVFTALLGAFSAGAVGENVYFMSINDIVLDLDDTTMPRTVNGVLYVPYTMFDPNFTYGDNLGVFSSYSPTKGTVLIYSRSGTLVFDLNKDNSSFGGSVYRDKAIIRNSMVFVPLDLVCRLFDLEWSRLKVEYGYIIRVKSGQAVLEDDEFSDAAYFAVRARYEKYVQSKAEAALPEAEPSSSPSPTPGLDVTDEPDADGARVYLAFRMGQGEGLAGILEKLEQNGLYALFFCPVEQLRRQDDQIRTLLAAGHRIGLILDAPTPQEQLAQWQRGNELLGHIARCESVLCLSENLEESGLDTLEETVYLWHTDLEACANGRSVSWQAAMVIDHVRTGRSYQVLMDDSAQSIQALSRVIKRLREEGCEFRLANEVVLK